ncbi:MAG: autotransporter-associated beta strand repeat-containing protein, partial [Proteobacteria bacterium]|nr:autotransporter-associated beta strand repeat-containing protein [Pseudomonadota bacterium]
FGVFEKSGTGTWTLSNTTAATTNWSITGGTLAISADNNLGAGASTVSLNGGTLQTTSALSSSRDITLNAGGGTFQTDAATTLSGVIGGGGGLTKAGTATLTLGATNTYTGATTINDGTLALNASGSIAASSGVDLASATAILDITSQVKTIKDLTGVTGSTIKLGNGQLQVGTSNSTVFAGQIQGSGSIDKLGTGTLTLSGAATNSGVTIIDGGTLQAGAANAFSASSEYRVGANTLDLNNFDNAIGQLEGTGTVTLGTATLTVAGNSSFTGQMTGSGGLTLNGTSYSIGSVMAYTGATTVQSGTLSVSSLGSMASSSGLNLAASGATFNISSSSGITIKDLTGVAGSVINLGSQALTVGTANDTTFAGAIGGGGSLVKQGSGQLTLSGANTYTGATTVNAGRLAVNGSLTSAVTVAVGGNLGGTGTITGDVTTNGTISPGNSIGTLNVTGTYTQAAGSTYSVEVNSGGQSDKINVTGNAVINGGTVSVQAASGTYARNTQYTILTASGTRTGNYSAVTSNLAFLTPSLSYDTNNVFLTLLSTSTSFRGGSQTPNQAAVGAVLDNNGSATGDFGNVINALFGLNTTDGAKALNTLSGQPIANFGTTNVMAGMGFLNTVGGMMSGFHHGFSGTG